jgi:BirA family biotin operon repressor/biotin-[acetyl-CoA-carboxylase] ligase
MPRLPMPPASPLLDLLADGRFHSGTELGRVLGVSRAAVWKQLQRLAGLGLEVEAATGRGYRLMAPLERLDAAHIRAQLAPATRGRLAALEVVESTDSTQRVLMEAARAGAASGHVLFAEHQRAGRGRRGRDWQSPFGAQLCASLLWRFECAPAELGGLSIALGVAAARALLRAGLGAPTLKWPNDLVHWQGGVTRKLGGILVELGGEADGPCFAVMGLGINLRLPGTVGAAIEQPWCDLAGLMGQHCPGRNALAAGLCDEVFTACARFAKDGLDSFLDDWRRWDAFAGRPVRLTGMNGSISGIARGVDARGALLLERDGVIGHHHAGELSLRSAA